MMHRSSGRRETEATSIPDLTRRLHSTYQVARTFIKI